MFMLPASCRHDQGKSKESWLITFAALSSSHADCNFCIKDSFIMLQVTQTALGCGLWWFCYHYHYVVMIIVITLSLEIRIFITVTLSLEILCIVNNSCLYQHCHHNSHHFASSLSSSSSSLCCLYHSLCQCVVKKQILRYMYSLPLSDCCLHCRGVFFQGYRCRSKMWIISYFFTWTQGRHFGFISLTIE